MEMILQWIITNRGTIIVMAILILILTLIILNMIKDRKKGKTGCLGGCEHCALKGKCHPDKTEQTP